ncbi:hypothetical protein [Labrys okinawensis]|uniref:hypothetical protein n=1 Tax=Labrys okinawensis TaxID=346911 RepID=UPI0011B28A7D|nr:hypothetical protein [Labrys okinawensis]
MENTYGILRCGGDTENRKDAFEQGAGAKERFRVNALCSRRGPDRPAAANPSDIAGLGACATLSWRRRRWALKGFCDLAQSPGIAKTRPIKELQQCGVSV